MQGKKEGKKRGQPVESSYLNGFFGCEASFFFSSADSVPCGCGLLREPSGIFL